MKLKTKHLTPYLPYNLQVEYRGEVTTLDALDSKGGAFVGKNRMVSFIDLKHIKPILRPLTSMKWEEARELMSIVTYDDDVGCVDIEASALENKVEIISCTPYGEYKIVIDNYDSDIKAYYEYYGGQIESLPVTYQAFQFIFKNHFDIFGLIEQSLAIEK